MRIIPGAGEFSGVEAVGPMDSFMRCGEIAGCLGVLGGGAYYYYFFDAGIVGSGEGFLGVVVVLGVVDVAMGIY